MSARIAGILVILGGLVLSTGGFWIQHTFSPPTDDPPTTSRFTSHHGLFTYLGKLLFVFGLCTALVGGMIGFA